MAFDFKTGWSRAWTGTGSPGDGSHRFAANGRSAVGRNSARWLEFVLKLQLGPRREFRSCRRLRADASSRANRCQPDDRRHSQGRPLSCQHPATGWRLARARFSAPAVRSGQRSRTLRSLQSGPPAREPREGCVNHHSRRQRVLAQQSAKTITTVDTGATAGWGRPCRRYRSRRNEAQRSMRPVPIVMLRKHSEGSFQVVLVRDE